MTSGKAPAQQPGRWGRPPQAPVLGTGLLRPPETSFRPPPAPAWAPALRLPDTGPQLPGSPLGCRVTGWSWRLLVHTHVPGGAGGQQPRPPRPYLRSHLIQLRPPLKQRPSPGPGPHPHHGHGRGSLRVTAPRLHDALQLHVGARIPQPVVGNTESRHPAPSSHHPATWGPPKWPLWSWGTESKGEPGVIQGGVLEQLPEP